jgi:hypothetical protein
MATKVSLADVVEALGTADDAFKSYLNRVTGQVITVSDEDLSYADEEVTPVSELPEWQRATVAEAREVLDSSDWLQLPGKFEIHEWALMQDFGRSLPPAAQRDEIADAIHRKGAFGNFKRIIRRLGVEDAWYAYRDRTLEDIAQRWLEEHQLEFDDDLERRGPERR